MKVSKRIPLIAILLAISLLLCGCDFLDIIFQKDRIISLADIPAFSGEPYVVINGGEPFFTEDEITDRSFEHYSELDELGRCSVAFACIGLDIMPTEDRDPNLDTEPSGWHSVKYDCVPNKYLYNRCHLIGYQLTGENDNENNLITGTRYLNIEGMLPFENMVADYVEETGNHVLYRVTPIFDRFNLVASGVLMEALSVEDGGAGIKFNVYSYNNQPGVVINYFDGTSYLDGEAPPVQSGGGDNQGGDNQGGDNQGGESEVTYILNTGSKKFHLPTCSGISKMKPENKKESNKTRDELILDGYDACGICNP